MEVDVKPGMWITHNLIAHQGDYIIFHVKNVKDNQVIYDVSITIKKTRLGGVWGERWRADFTSPEGVMQMPKSVLRKSSFQAMKRPSQDIRRASIVVLFGDR